MAILKYSEVRDKASTLRAMTSLDRAEFERLAEVFGQAWTAYQERVGRDRTQGGRPEQLKGIEDKLFWLSMESSQLRQQCTEQRLEQSFTSHSAPLITIGTCGSD